MNNEFQIIPAHAINTKKWDVCIAQSHTPLIYAYTRYLNALCPQWVGFVLNNYEAVMPVPFKRKCGIAYCYQPNFIQQLGLFEKNYNTYPIHELLKWVLKEFKYGNLFIPFYHPLPNIQNCTIQVRDNFVLNLKADYSQIAANYSGDLKRNLMKAYSNQLVYHDKTHAQLILNHFYQLYHPAMHLKQQDITAFATLLMQNEMQSYFFVRGVNAANGVLVAGAIFLKDCNRIYNIMNFTTEAGRKLSANHYLLDQCIHEFAGKALLFDFEGSSQKGIQAFYKNFHPDHHPYLQLHINQLPLLFRYLKQ
ncbi:MAG: hypothetical protein GTN67_08835 [Hydrotalea flava]|uniref:hypothetical protein n=1 Tax=Hydrotalea lipotrueae TaxID=2803817 RepID=UPI0009456858|nr:hypothetical protein [Hydrotalea lipotrueae]MBY0348075.1 hypothetical protein [Hydrotalea flava]NIM35468.1 hypothetical protein [Hydrotalea flava]NIM38326.1 hypothetical protein [Hydrotalea flava]NIN03497.1 hypothetical protein [Hydrotalea flava]NIN15184.1 hypothetical protein [Hydrotalea flava]